MSLARQFFREMRPLFRMLEEPLGRPPTYLGTGQSIMRPDFDNFLTRPAVDISDKGDQYVVEADLPGVKKDNIEIRIGDSGRSLTIEGKVRERGGPTQTPQADQSQVPNSTAVSKTDESATQLTAERPYTRNVSFTRTVWLPRAVDAKDVSAKLDHGVLTVKIKKTDDMGTTVVPISD